MKNITRYMFLSFTIYAMLLKYYDFINTYIQMNQLEQLNYKKYSILSIVIQCLFAIRQRVFAFRGRPGDPDPDPDPNFLVFFSSSFQDLV